MRPTTKTTNLTPARTDLIGRDLEIARLRELFESGRFVTITGIGGTGKTRLAREFGRMAVPDFPGGVWMIELAKFEGAEEALRELAEMFGLGFGAAASAVQPIIEAVRNKPRTLIVFDNLEHLIEEMADPLARILDGTKDVCILTTSREPVRIGGEQRFKLSPLGQEAAMKLFERRAAEVIPTFTIDDSNRDAIEELVDRLDRLPLAIELAAARVNVLPPAQLVDRITNRMRALRARDRDRPERHETLMATIEWSWDLLTDPQRRGLAHCSVFRGGFTLEALEAVADHDGLVEDLVEDLVERSLLEFEDSDRGRRFLLFEMVRSAAEMKLEEMGLADAAAARHAKFFVDMIENTPTQQIYARQADLPNLLVALRRVSEPELKASVVIAAARVLRLSAGVPLAEETMSELIGQVSEPATIAKLLLFRGIASSERGDLEASLADTAAAAKLALECEDFETAADAYTLHGFTLTHCSKVDEGIASLNEGLELARRIHSARLETIALGNLAIVASEQGELKKAEELFSDALSRCRAAKDDVLIGRGLMNLAVCQSWQERWHEALTNLEESLEFHERVGDDRFRGLAYVALGSVRANLGDVDGAAEAFTLGQEFAHALGNRSGETRALIGLGELGRGSADRTYLIQAVQLNEGAPNWQDEARPRCHLAIHDMLGHHQELARPQFRRAISQVVPHDSFWGGLLWGYLALSYAMTHDRDPAEEAVAKLRELWADADKNTSLSPSFIAELVDLIASGNTARPSDIVAVRERLDAMSASKGDWGRRPPGWTTHDPADVLARVAELTFGPLSAVTLAVSRDGRRFVPPGSDEVDFSRRGPLRKIIVALAEAREGAPGAGLSPDDVLEAGWPGDVVTADAGAARVYSAIRTLRTNGLEDVLLTQDDGYLIDPDVSIMWLD